MFRAEGRRGDGWRRLYRRGDAEKGGGGLPYCLTVRSNGGIIKPSFPSGALGVIARSPHQEQHKECAGGRRGGFDNMLLKKNRLRSVAH